MTDELDLLKSALQSAPAPDAAAKTRALRLAQENFAQLQETAAAARPTPKATFLETTMTMLTSNLRPALYATSCLVMAGAAFVTYQGWDATRPTVTTHEPAALELAPQDEAAVARTDMPMADMAEAEVMEAAPSPSPKVSKRVRPQGATLGKLSATNPSAADNVIAPPQPDREIFAGEAENPVKVTAEDPISTFSIDVDTASYAYVRAAILDGALPRPEAVRVEEMVNYFTYAYPAPSDAPFSTNVAVTSTPWNPDTKLVRISLQGALPAIEDRPPLNLVFLIDTSGSMQAANKLPLLKQSFRLMLSELRAEDQVAIVTYAGAAGTVLEPTPASERAKILAALDTLEPGGSTAGQAGLHAAYALAEQMTDGEEVSRVLLATDGDFNVGINNPDALKTFIEDKRDTGVYLSVLGFGRGNYRDDMMQTLAQSGNGTAAYIDTLAEAQKVLVDQLTGALFPIANDVKIQVEFNPSVVGEYRLIGYETRALNREDFNNDKVDAGEIGAGHQVTALYEVTPVGSPALLNDPLRYGEAAAATDNEELGFLKLRYKTPGAAESTLVETPITDTADRRASAGWAAAMAGFAQLLRGSNYTGDWTYTDAIALAEASKGADPHGLRAEAIRLIKLAESLAE
ncbi:MAG: VWA domain-containing protein [Pseudomonadota bacterium]